MNTFDVCFAIVVGEEGGYVNDPHDPGGETKYGVSKRSYPATDIANLTMDGAKAIYQRDFWTKTHCDELPPPLALLVFDSAVNNGPDRAIKFLQAAVGATQDGVIGNQTLTALQQKKLGNVVAEFQALRILFQMTLPTAARYGLGWARRLSHLLLASTTMEQAAPASQPHPLGPVTPVVLTHVLTPDMREEIEREITRQLQDRAYVDALNQHPQGSSP